MGMYLQVIFYVRGKNEILASYVNVRWAGVMIV